MITNMIVKKITTTIIKFFVTVFFKISIKLTNKKIYIFDIDNTLADTWISFTYRYTSEFERYSSLAVFYKMRNYILSLNNCRVIFLSARPFKVYKITYHWLKSIGVINNVMSLILVDKPNDKIKLLKNIKKKVIFFDDMSYNHEYGEIKYYTNEIYELYKLPNIEYIDANRINKIIKEGV